MATADNESDLIALIAANELQQRETDSVILGIGDDAAIIRVAENHDLVTCTDTLVVGVHFPLQTSAYDIGWKSLAVNISDLAAMAATPRFAQLALTLPNADTEWLKEFLAGWQALASQYNIGLIGGDTTRGPLSITVQAMGEIPRGQAALRRGRAQIGDVLVVSGDLGGAALALQQLQAGETVDSGLALELNRPQPRVALGSALRGLATSAIDLSDGLAIDLPRLMAGSGLGAKIHLQQLPLKPTLAALGKSQRYSLAVSGGDDYELLFSLPAELQSRLAEISSAANVSLTVIGEVQANPAVELLTTDGSLFTPNFTAYEHFNENR
ncbi:MAG: thiamine-phosphate kinase [Xanthomonadales bacterium]|nr:thiamine-phosphate kinase [Xanthomonadales bacterium]